MTALSAIQDVTVRDWRTGEVITPAKLEVDFAKLRRAVNAIKAYLEDRQLNFANSSAPNDIANGQLWFDLGNAILNLRRSGAWEQVLTEGTVDDADLIAGGGTGTFKQGGSVSVVTADANGTSAISNTYLIPGNTMESDGSVFYGIMWGNKTAGFTSVNDVGFSVFDDGLATASFIPASPATTVICEVYAIRKSETSVGLCFAAFVDADSTGGTALSNETTTTATLSDLENFNTTMTGGGDKTIEGTILQHWA